MKFRIIFILALSLVLLLPFANQVSQAAGSCYANLQSANDDCIIDGVEIAVCLSAAANAFHSCIESLNPQPDPSEWGRCMNTCQTEFDGCIAAGVDSNTCWDAKFSCQFTCESAFGEGF